MSYTIDNNPFYNAVSPGVSKEIDTRASMYAARARGTSNSAYIHSWLHRKTAYVKIYYDDKLILEPPTKGFNDVYGKDLYPPAVVNSVRISNEGDYGSLLKADINFSVFTLSQLSYYTENLLFVGSYSNLNPIPVRIEYGWTAGNDGPTENFYGFVTNFNWTLRPDGGFDCVSNLVGEGYFSLGTKIGEVEHTDPGIAAANELVKKITTGPLAVAGNIETTPLNWIEELYTENAKFRDGTNSGNPGKPIVGAGFNSQIGYIRPESGNAVAVITIPLNDQGPEEESSTAKTANIIYVTLDFICAAVTTNLQRNSVFKDHQYICNDSVTLGWKYQDLVSADPKNILFPDYATYGARNLTEGVDISMISGNNNTVALNKILVSVDCLYEISNRVKIEPSARTNFKAVDDSISNFFKTLFTKINEVSGGLYALSLVTPSVQSRKREDLNKWLIMDTQYIPKSTDRSGEVPKIIPTMKSGTNGYGGICRSVSLTATLPNAMATAQFVSAASSLSGKVPFIKPKTTKVNVSNTKAIVDSLRKNAAAALANGFTSADITQLRTSLDSYKTEAVPGGTGWQSGFPIPLNLQLVMDGIKGFRFGNTITIDYLPEGYENVVFTVTKIEHNITNNDWTTTLSTVCRLKI